MKQSFFLYRVLKLLLLYAIFLSTELTMGNDIVLQSSERTAIHFEKNNILHYCCISVSKGFNTSKSNVKSVRIWYDGVYRDSIPKINGTLNYIDLWSSDSSIDVNKLLEAFHYNPTQVVFLAIHGFDLEKFPLKNLEEFTALTNLFFGECKIPPFAKLLSRVNSESRSLSIGFEQMGIKSLPNSTLLKIATSWNFNNNNIINIDTTLIPSNIKYMYFQHNPLDSITKDWAKRMGYIDRFKGE